MKSHEVEDLLQEVLLALHNFILENGFVDSVARLRELAASPEARATFDKALAEYTAWLRTRRG